MYDISKICPQLVTQQTKASHGYVPCSVSVAMLRTVAALLLLWPLICYGFVLLSFPAAGSAAVSRQFQLGVGHSYRLESTVLLNEAGPRVGKDVGYMVTATLNVGVVWQSPFDPNDKLLQLEVSAKGQDFVSNESVLQCGPF